MNPQVPDSYQPEPADAPAPQQAPAPDPTLQPPVTPLSATPAAEPSYDVHYLNSIAAPATAKRISPVMMFSIIGGVIALAIAAFLVMIAPHGTPDTTLIRQAEARATTIRSLADDQSNRLNDPDLDSANLLIATSFKSITADFARLASAGKKSTKPDKSIAAGEDKYYAGVAKNLDTAYQRGTLDTAYPTQMIYELQVYQSQLRSLARSSQSTAVQASCTDALKSIDVILGLLAHEPSS